MAEASASTSTMSQAALLREAARQTMRRKQASDKSIKSLQGPVSIPSPSPLPLKPVPIGPRGPGLTSSITLDYGDPSEALLRSSVQPQSLGADPSGVATPSSALSSKPPRKPSVARAKGLSGEPSSTEKPGSREEGEISDEDKRTATIVVNGNASAGATSNGTAPVSNQARPSQSTAPTPRRNSIKSMQPPPLPTNVHREAAPISPTAAIGTSSPTTRPPRSSTLGNGSSRSAVPTPESHSFDNLARENSMEGEGDRLSPRTTQRNQEVFTRLLQLGVDEDHCRPGLPMTFEQYNTAKGLILDLLGYGLTPDNIVDIGVDKRLVVYCLRELKIRLPGNVTVDDILLYEPPEEDENTVASDTDHLPSPPDENGMLSPTQEMQTTEIESTAQVVNPPPANGLPPRPTVQVNGTTPALNGDTRLNVNAQPFVPSQIPMGTTTGPSLLAMALRTQRILPPRPTSPIPILPISLPPRPTFDHSVPPRVSKPISSDVNRESISAPADDAQVDKPVQTSETEKHALERLEQKTRMELLRRKLELKKKRADGKTPTITTMTPADAQPLATVTQAQPAETTSSPLILEGDRHSSPGPMDIDIPIVAPASRPLVATRSTVESIATIPSRAATIGEETRSSTPSDFGPKRGVKRPKADDFVEDFPVKRAARVGGIPPPVKHTSFAVINSALPEPHVITWIDDDELDVEEGWSRSRELTSVHQMKDVDAMQIAAAAMALGLPMTAEELEAARMQEEKRKAEFEAKQRKLKETQARLKRLEVKKVEKKLRTSTAAKVEPGQIAVETATLQRLRQELADIEATLADLSGNASTPTFEMAQVDSTPSLVDSPSVSTPVYDASEQAVEALFSIAEQQLSKLDEVAQDTLQIDPEAGDMSPDDDLDVVMGDEPASVASPYQEDGENDITNVDMLHRDAAAQTRFSTYTPPLMLPALPPLQHSDFSSSPHDDANTANTSTNTSKQSQRTLTSLTDPNRELCQFETNGGQCRDPDCQYLHFKDFLPTDGVQS